MPDRLVDNQWLLDEVAHKWVKIHNLLTFAGFGKKKAYQFFDQTFGPEKWAPAHYYRGRVISRLAGYLVYEDSYYHAFKNDPELAAWIQDTASEVYDIAESNLGSGLDYTAQECGATHLQDISVRRALTRLMLEEKGHSPDPANLPALPIFRGDHLVQIRDRETEGFRLNPGQVRFHEPRELPGFQRKSWWLPGSVEDWYQKAKLLLVAPESLCLEPALASEAGLHLAWGRSHFLLIRNGDPLTALAARRKDVLAAAEAGVLGCCLALVNRSPLPYPELAELARRCGNLAWPLGAPQMHQASFVELAAKSDA